MLAINSAGLTGRSLAAPLQRGSLLAARPASRSQVGRRQLAVRASADAPLTGAQKAALIGGAIFNPIVLFSEWTLFQTGQGLDPGPGGIYGAAEGIGFLVVPGIVIYSLVTKARTGSGLPAGPSGALGAVEGLSFLTTLLGVLVFGYEFATKGGLPGITG